VSGPRRYRSRARRRQRPRLAPLAIARQRQAGPVNSVRSALAPRFVAGKL
jgi:hypothetical protein